MTMDLEEFETQYRNNIETTLNHLQTVLLLLAQLEIRVINVGQDLRNLSETVEEFVIQQRDE